MPNNRKSKLRKRRLDLATLAIIGVIVFLWHYAGMLSGFWAGVLALIAAIIAYAIDRYIQPKK